MDAMLNILDGEEIYKIKIERYKDDDLLQNCCFDSRLEIEDLENSIHDLEQAKTVNNQVYEQIREKLKGVLIDAINDGWTAINWYINAYDNTITIEATNEQFTNCNVCIYYPVSFDLIEVKQQLQDDLEHIKKETGLDICLEWHFAIL